MCCIHAPPQFPLLFQSYRYILHLFCLEMLLSMYSCACLCLCLCVLMQRAFCIVYMQAFSLERRAMFIQLTLSLTRRKKNRFASNIHATFRSSLESCHFPSCSPFVSLVRQFVLFVPSLFAPSTLLRSPSTRIDYCFYSILFVMYRIDSFKRTPFSLHFARKKYYRKRGKKHRPIIKWNLHGTASVP